MTTIKDVRLALKSTLEVALTDVEVWPGLLGTVPHLPAVIIRRGAYKTDTYAGQVDPDPSFDLICCQSLDVPERALDMDDLVATVVESLRDNRTISGEVADVQIVGVGHEERIPQGGPNNSPMLAVGVTINVILL